MNKYTILNAYGSLWTSEAFEDEASARRYLETTITWIKPEKLPHKIVPIAEVTDYQQQLAYFTAYE